MNFMTRLVVCFGIAFVAVVASNLSLHAPKFSASPKSKRHSRTVEKFSAHSEKKHGFEASEVGKMKNDQLDAGEFARVWRTADGQVHFDLQVIYPSACYKAGDITFERKKHWLKRFSKIAINTQIEFLSGMCAQSATPIRFTGVIPANIAIGFHRTTFVVTNLRDQKSNVIGTFAF